MKTVAVVAWREVVEHRVFVAAAIAALGLTLVVPLASGLFKATPADVREIVMVCMVLGFVPLVALLLGASTVSGTVAAGRFGFFLSRPVPGAAIWMGKLIGVLVVVLACEAIILAPAVVGANPGGIVEQMASDLPYDYDSPLPRIAAVTGIAMLPLALVLVAHAIATLWRGRSVWLLLDLITLLAGATVAWISLRPLINNEANVATAVVVLALAAATFLALVSAPYFQATFSGIDPYRQHRVFSVACAVTLAVLFAAVGSYAGWLTAPSVADLMRAGASITPSPDGRWIGARGYSSGRWDYEAAFLVDLGSSTAVRIDAGPRWGATFVAFSAGGRRAAWLGGSGEPYQIRYCDLDQPPVRRKDTAIFVSGDADFRLSAGGDQIAVIDDDTLAVSSIPGGELVGASQVSSGVDQWGRRDLLFATDQSFRVIGEAWSLSIGEWVARVTEFSLSTRTFHHHDSSARLRCYRAQYDSGRDRMLCEERDAPDQPWRYLDARTLEDIEWARQRRFGTEVVLLGDGRLLDVVWDGGACRFEVLTPEGALEASFPLPLQDWLRDARKADLSFGHQPSSDRLALRVRRCLGAPTPESSSCEWRAGLVTLSNGSFEEMDEATIELARIDWWRLWDTVDMPLPPESPVTRLAWVEGGYALWEPETGETEVLAARYE